MRTGIADCCKTVETMDGMFSRCATGGRIKVQSLLQAWSMHSGTADIVTIVGFSETVELTA